MAFLAALAPTLFTATASSSMAAGSVAAVSAAAPTIAASSLLPSLSTIATIGSVGASLLGAGSQLQAGKVAEQVGEYNAQLATREAAARTEAAKQETFKLSRAANATMGEQVAAFGSSGFSVNEGSPLEVMANTAREYERDILMTGYGGQVGATQKLNEASLYKWQGGQQRKASTWGAGTTLLTGLSDMAISQYGTRKYLRRI